MTLDGLMREYEGKSPREKLAKLAEVTDLAETKRVYAAAARARMSLKEATAYDSEYTEARLMRAWIFDRLDHDLHKQEHGELREGGRLTRRAVLMECLRAYEEALTACSMHGLGLTPLKGKEERFDELQKKCALLPVNNTELRGKQAI